MGASTAARPVLQETVGERLRRLRQERGLSQRQIASPRCTYAYISRIEAGDRVPSVKALRLLAGRLGVNARYLETGEDMIEISLPRVAVDRELARWGSLGWDDLTREEQQQALTGAARDALQHLGAATRVIAVNRKLVEGNG